MDAETSIAFDAWPWLEWAGLVALALGTTLAVWLLEGCGKLANAIERRWGPHTSRCRRPNPYLGGWIFLFLMIGVPTLVVLWGYATGRLPA